MTTTRFLLSFLSVFGLLVSPSMAQFGLMNKRKKPASFEDLNEQAKAEQGGAGAGGVGAGLGGMGGLGALGDMGDMGDMMGALGNIQDMWAEAMKDPEVMSQINAMAGQLNDAFGELSKMTPEQVQAQMAQAFEMMGSPEIVDSIIGKSDEVLKSLEESGLVPKEELEKYKKDPKYFELKMRESFDQMQDIFKDPDMIKAATETLATFSKTLYGGDGEGGMLNELLDGMLLSDELSNDDKIEEARLELLSNPDIAGNPALAAMFNSEEMQEVLKDPVKWRESVKKGQGILKEDLGAKKAKKAGAGVGEF